MSKSILSKEQSRVLLHKHLTGEFPERRWETILSLLRMGMLDEQGKNLVVSEFGRQYCDQHHLEM